MAFSINTNVSSLSAHASMIRNDNKLSESLGRLSTGLRINKAADDASGMAIADSLRAQHMGIGQAVRNANDGISIVQTADGALEESINIINTIKTKAIQAASDGQTSTTRTAIQNDIDKLMEELDAIAKTTSYNGQKLLSGAFTNKSIQIGAFSNETANISIASAESTKMGHVTQADLSMASEAGGEVQLTITSSITGEKLTLSTVDIQSNNDAGNGMGALADEVNRYASITGINADAIVESTSQAITAGTTGSDFAINGINIGAITVENNDANNALISAINDKSAEHGISATLNTDGSINLTSGDGRAIEITGAVSDVMGSTASQMSTIGYLSLTQEGVSQFQINGIGAGATGKEIQLSATGDLTTVKDSVLASGSTVNAGSMFASGTVTGGDAVVESSVAATQLDYQLTTGSSLYSFTEVAQGTTLGATVTIGGNTNDAATEIAEDMIATAGSTLQDGSILGAGTVVTTDFVSTNSGASVSYSAGDTLTSSVTLTQDLTLDKDMTLKFSSTTAENSALKNGSTIAVGSTMGVKSEIGVTYDSTASNITVSSAGQTTVDVILNANLVSTTAGGFLIKAGSLLVDDSELMLGATSASATSVWTGPTLVTDSGIIEAGDTIQHGQLYTLSGDQVLSEDLTTADDSNGDSTIGQNSVLVQGFTATGATTGGAGQAGEQVTLSTATLTDEMTLKAGSELSAGSTLLAGSEMGNNTYVMGGSLNASQENMVTYSRTELAAGSTIESSSKLAEGSTIGGSVTVNGQTELDSDMTLTAGTVLAGDTKFEQGTGLAQDMTLYDASHGGTAFDVKAGDVLTQDLWVSTEGGTATITLGADMTLKEDSTIGAASVLAVNTANSGSVGLSETTSYTLSDLNVLTQEGAQIAIDIADAALSDLDAVRSGLGSVQNQLTSTISNLSVTKTNIQASESAIRDVDFAAEAANYSSLSLLAQTSSYALAQSNAKTQTLMSLLQ